MTSLSKLDTAYRSILLSKFFTKGWGKPENLKRLFAFRKIISNRESCRHLVESDYPVHIDKVEDHSQYKILDGHLFTPFAHHLSEVVPEECRIARFQVILPTVWPADPLRPVCLHLAGTGDHFYWRRRMLMCRPLLKENAIGSIILENPFYGSRKPKNQSRSSLHNVSDIFVMGGCLILESLALFHWCEREGLGPLGISGISMGGHMASLAGCSWHKPLPIIPCLSWTSASGVFTQGVMSGAIPWHLLQNQYSSDNVYQDEIRRMLHSPEECEAFFAGVHFSRTYPSSLRHMEMLQDKQMETSIGSHVDRTNLISSNNSTSHLFNRISTPPVTGKPYVFPDLHCNNSETIETELKSHLLNQKPLLNFNRKDNDVLKLEALSFMRGIMDECTHLGNFTPPVDPTLSIVVTARHDAYVPRDGIKPISDLWPGCEVRYIDSGHIAAFLFNQGVFRKAIVDAFEKTAQKYYCGSVISEDTKSVLKQDARS